jgi:hypothetical protein
MKAWTSSAIAIATATVITSSIRDFAVDRGARLVRPTIVT